MGVRILPGDARERLAELPADSVHCCVTSPPYFGLRDYGVEGQIGLEETPEAFVAALVDVFREVRRVLRADGTLWLNLGDSYASGSGHKTITPQTAYVTGRAGGDPRGAAKKTLDYETKVAGFKNYGELKPKDLIGIPWRVAFALQADGWWLRQDIIWSKPNPMPESVTDRCTKAHEYLFLLSRSERYAYDADAIAESALGGGRFNGSKVYAAGDRNDAGRRDEAAAESRNKRSVWTVATQPFSEAHFATFPPDLIEPCILAGCPVGGTVLDPFGGAGTTGLVADRLGRNAILIELNPAYADMARRRIASDAPLLADVS